MKKQTRGEFWKSVPYPCHSCPKFGALYFCQPLSLSERYAFDLGCLPEQFMEVKMIGVWCQEGLERAQDKQFTGRYRQNER